MTEQSLIEPRRDYEAATLRRSMLQDDALRQFENWLGDARRRDLIDATAMALSTVDASGRPHTRIVLLKNIDASGFTFYTNHHSDKGVQLAGNPNACLLFYWRELERQVRILGTVQQLDPVEADAYFHSRPEGSRFSAAASQQSQPVTDRKVLEDAVTRLRLKYPTGEVPRPAHWGGYLLTPDSLEFWQGRADRLHDRFIYIRQPGPTWSIERLSP